MTKPVITLLFIASIFLSPENANSQNSSEAVQYMSNLFAPLQETKNETWQYLKAVTKSKGAKKVEKKRQNLLVEIRNVRSEVNRQHAYKSDDTLRKAIVDYLNLSYIILKEDYGKILNLEEIAEQSYDNMEAYLLAKEKAGDKFDEAWDILKLAEENFAAKYDINLVKGEDDKMTQKIKKANEALKYYNEIYLIFFKSYKQEIYVLDAIKMSDLNGMVQNTNTLLSFTNEGIQKIKASKSYLGDIRLKRAANKMLLFYKREAEIDFPAMQDYYIKKDNFEKVEKLFNSKSKRNRTQQDYDKFNKAVNEYNAAVKSTNQISNSGNIRRDENLELWNKAVKKFFDDHS